jgi:hypothetical protein
MKPVDYNEISKIYDGVREGDFGFSVTSGTTKNFLQKREKAAFKHHKE